MNESNNEEKITLGKYLKEARFLTKLKAQEVADKAGIDFTVLSRYENDKRVPRIGVLIKLIKILDMDFEKVMEIYDNQKN